MVHNDPDQCDFTLGQDCLTRHGMNLNFESNEMEWDGKTMPMHEPGHWENCELEDTQVTLNKCDHAEELSHGGKSMIEQLLANGIRDNDYSETDFENYVQQLRHLSLTECNKLFQCLKEHNDLFQGCLGEIPGVEAKADSKPNAVPCHCKQAFCVLHMHINVSKKEADQLCLIGALEKTDGSSP